MQFKKLTVIILVCLFKIPSLFAQSYPFKSYRDGEILENDPENSRNLSVAIYPVDVSHHLSSYASGITGEVMYRSPNEIAWVYGAYTADYYLKYGSHVLESRPENASGNAYNKPSNNAEVSLGINAFSKIINRKRQVLLSGWLSNIKTYAVVKADYYVCFGVHGGLTNTNRYIYSEYETERAPDISGYRNLNKTEYKTESYANIQCAAFGLHFQTIDDLKLKIVESGQNKTRTNKSVITYYVDFLLPLKRSFSPITVIAYMDSTFNPVYSTLNLSPQTVYRNFGFKIGVRSNDLALPGFNLGAEAGSFPGVAGGFSNFFLRVKLGISLNFKAKKTTR